MSRDGPRPRWLFEYGVWIRRSLLAISLAIPFMGKALGVAGNSRIARHGFFAALGLCSISLLLYAVEYLLAVRHRGYWFDHHFD